MAIHEFEPQSQPYVPEFRIVPILELASSEERQKELQYLQYLERGAVDYELRLDGVGQGVIDLDISKDGRKATIDGFDARESLNTDPLLNRMVTPLLALSVCEVHPEVRFLIIQDKLAAVRFH